jgi:3',5'-nucleoside bisphosphate phosphatase
MDIAAVAVTDHDTVEGVAEALEAGGRQGVEVVPGVEISADYQRNSGVMHILGYDIDPASAELGTALAWVQSQRNRRNPQVVERLQKLGIEVTYEQVCEIAGGGQVGRPHIARAMLAAGAVDSIQQAFDEYLHVGQPAYVDKSRLSSVDAIGAIRAAGGLPVLAHPSTLGLDDSEELAEVVAELVDIGLVGVEAIYSGYTTQQTSMYEAIAQRFGLAVTGGSDFHGDSKPDVVLGIDETGCAVPYALLERLREPRSEPNA